jgi:flagellar hook-associated protein 3 FlgL
MRVTTQMLSSGFAFSLSQHLERLDKEQEMISSGKKVNRPSDDPTGSSTILDLKHRIRMNDQYKRNAQDALMRLGVLENYYNDLQNNVSRARELAIEGGNRVLSKSDLKGIAVEVNQILEHVLSVANKENMGQYIFGGTKADKAPFKATRNEAGEITAVEVTGDISGTVYRQIGEDEQMPINTSTEGLFTGDGNLFEKLINLRDALQDGDSEKITQAIGDMKDSSEAIIQRLSEVGVHYSHVQDQMNELDLDSLTLTSAMADLQDADFAKTMIDLQTEQVAYQAALQVGGQMIQQSFVNFLR